MEKELNPPQYRVFLVKYDHLVLPNWETHETEKQAKDEIRERASVEGEQYVILPIYTAPWVGTP